MALENITGWFTKFKKPFIIAFIIYTFAIIIIGIYSGLMYWKETGDYKPFIESIGGSLVTAEYNIVMDMKELQNPSNSLQYNDYLKKEILNNLIKFIIFFMIIFTIVKWILLH